MDSLTFLTEKQNKSNPIIVSGSSSRTWNSKALFTELEKSEKTNMVIASGNAFTSYALVMQ